MNSQCADQVSVIIPLHRGGEVFRHCLDSVVACQPPPGEILVVADGPGDGTWAYAEQKGVRVIRKQEREGPAAARNAGARVAKGRVLLFLDADVTVPPDLIARLCEQFQKHPEASALFGSYDNAPSEPGFYSQYRNLFHHYIHQQGREEASTFWGACGAINRTVFWEVGGFDECYRAPTVEDIELGYRLRQRGYRIRLCKGLQVKHGKRWTLLGILKTDFCDRALPWTELLLRYGQFCSDLNLRHESRASVTVIFLLCLSAGLSLYRWHFLIPLPFFCLVLLALNWRVYAFFVSLRGAAFAARAVPMHWLYYLSGGVAFGLGAVIYGMRRAMGRRPRGKQRLCTN